MSDEAIHKAVDAARTFLQNDAERRAYINWELAILDYNSDHRDAFEEGEVKGREEGQQKLGRLMSLLLKEKRYDDAAKAAENAEFREKLFKEYGMWRRLTVPTFAVNTLLWFILTKGCG